MYINWATAANDTPRAVRCSLFAMACWLPVGLILLACQHPATACAEPSADERPLWTSLSPASLHAEASAPFTLVGYDSYVACDGCAASDCGCGGLGGGCHACQGADWGCGPRIDHSGTWVTLDYLLWQVSGYGVPALVTTSPPDTDRTESGVLPGATILFGNEDLENDLRSGGRLRFGYWYDDCRTSGFEGSFAALGQESSNFFAEADGSARNLSRPFFNTDPNVDAQDALIIGFDEPGGDDAFAGSTRVTTSSNVYSGHFAWRRNVRRAAGHRLDLTAGYRFFRLDEGLQINDDITVDGVDGGIVGTNFQIRDQFNTSNAFHGAELGLVSMTDYGRWSTEFIAKLALGNNHREVTIDGSTTTTVGGVSATAAGGLLTQSTNIGSYRDDRFVAIPEFNANFNYRVSERFKLTAGYTVIFMSDVVRPGGQIDTDVNGTLLLGPFDGPATPTFDFDSESLWVHGLNFGGQFNY